MKGNRRIHKPLVRTSKTAKPRKLEFGDVKEGQAQQDGSSRASRRHAIGVSAVAAEAPDQWHIVPESESEEEEIEEDRRFCKLGMGSNTKKLEQEATFIIQDTSTRGR